MQEAAAFYDAMAGDYHLIFADWAASVRRQGALIDGTVRQALPETPSPISVLDCSCGIGTQAIGLALRAGYTIHATDISANAVARARTEAARFGVDITFDVADMRQLSQDVPGQFDVVLSFDNSVPHLLTDDELSAAAREMFAKTRSGGLLLVGIRDYDAMLIERPQWMAQRVMENADGKRLTFQLWEWDGDYYTVNQFILIPTDASLTASDGWETHHYATRYRALRRAEWTAHLEAAGFSDVRWMMPEESGHYQPVVLARRA